jgi:ABC-type Fe3+/spermidine/putrescine transport system ATPase subunit
MSLVVRDLRKRFGELDVLRDVALELEHGRYACIMGPSGCGKTTLLRVIAGLEVQDSGEVVLDGRKLDGVAPEHRPVRMVFQQGALFPHLDVAENVGFALRIAGTSGKQLDARVDELLDAVGLDSSMRTRAPDTLSGGERQRVALARALAADPGAERRGMDPRVLLLDEPLTAIDRPLRAGLRERLRALQRESGRLFVHVTHDPAEALALADRLVVIDGGRVLADGDAELLYRRPPDLVTARLLGEVTAVPVANGEAVRGWLRPERLRMADGDARVRGRVVERILHGTVVELVVECSGARCRLRDLDGRGSVGDEIGLSWNDDDVLRLRE